MSTLIDTTNALFCESGRLSRLAGFEYRAQQHRMALDVAAALEGRDHLIIEAPTGVGKTLAYLVPGILFASLEHRKAIVTTHTKNLQEQLLHNDVPTALRILDTPFESVTLKGRKNYLCLRRLASALTAPDLSLDDNVQQELQEIAAWAGTTPDGDVERLPFLPRPDIWDAVCSEQGLCNSSLCGHGCFFHRARERARRADLIIMNHALFFTLMGMQSADDRYVFENDFVIVDEAHTLESVASTGAGKRVTQYQLLLLLHRLYSQSSKKGLLALRRKGEKTLIRRVEREVKAFFKSVRSAADSLVAATPRLQQPDQFQVRIRSPYIVRNSLQGPLEELSTRLLAVEETCEDETVQLEVAAVHRRLSNARVLLQDFLEQSDPAFTYWIEWGSRPTSPLALCSAPSDVAETVGPLLFRPGIPIVMTSATLSVGNDLTYFKTRIGGTGAKGVLLDSPFNHYRQMRVCITRDIPDPESSDYRRALHAWILRGITRTQGRALVLFTNSSLMHTIASALAPELATLGIRCLVQGMHFQRHELLEEFRQDEGSVLFGLDSFWSGVDVPGKALQHVMITRLPFPVPNHPLIEARLEAIAARGGNAFLEYTLPEAVIKLRQGVGRLIRSYSDEGLVTIFDSRILSKSYGRIFLESLPRCPIEIWSATGETEDLVREEGW